MKTRAERLLESISEIRSRLGAGIESSLDPDVLKNINRTIELAVKAVEEYNKDLRTITSESEIELIVAQAQTSVQGLSAMLSLRPSSSLEKWVKEILPVIIDLLKVSLPLLRRG